MSEFKSTWTSRETGQADDHEIVTMIDPRTYRNTADVTPPEGEYKHRNFPVVTIVAVVLALLIGACLGTLVPSQADPSQTHVVSVPSPVCRNAFNSAAQVISDEADVLGLSNDLTTAVINRDSAQISVLKQRMDSMQPDLDQHLDDYKVARAACLNEG